MTGATTPLRVALADDSAEARALLRAMLEVVDGVDVVGAASDGAQAVELVAQESPDLILLDIAMPVMDGLEAAAAIRARTPGTKIAMYSGYNRVRMRPAALAAGADEYVEKAASIDELLDQIQQLFPDRPSLTIKAARPTPPPVAGAGIPAQTSLEQRYRLLLDALEEGVLVTDGDGVVSDANFVATQILRAPLRRLVGRTLPQVGIDGGSRGARTMEAALRKQRPMSGIQYSLDLPDGERRELLLSVRPLHDPASLSVHESLVSFVDLTELKTAEQQLHAAISSMHDAFFLFKSRRDASGAITDLEYVRVNDEGCRINGRPAEELIGHGLVELFPSHIETGLFDWYRAVVETGEPYTDVVTYDAETVKGTFDLTTTKAGDGILIVSTDVTDRLQTESEVQHLTHVLNRTQQIAGTGGWEYDVATGSQTWSDEVYRILGLAKADGPLSLASAIDAFEPDSRKVFEEAWRDATEGGRPYDVEATMIRGDGEPVQVRAVGEPVLEDGQVSRIEGMLVDITVQKQAQLVSAVNEQRYRRMIETTQEGVFLIDGDNRMTFVNDRFAQMLGCTPEELIGTSALDHVADESLGDLQRAVERRRSGRSDTYEVQLRRKDDSTMWAIISGSATPDAAGRPAGSFAMVTDSTDRKRAELALAAGDRRLRRTMDALREGVVVVTPVRDERGQVSDLRVEEINEAGCRLAHGTREELLGGLLCESRPWHRSSGLMDRYVHTVETGEPFFVTAMEMPVVWQGRRQSAFFDVSGVISEPHLILTWEDVTDEVINERSRTDAEERLRMAIHSMKDAFFIARARRDEHGTITDLVYALVNEAACRLTGTTADELVGHGYVETWPAAAHFEEYCAVIETGVPFTTTFDADATNLGVPLRVTVTKVDDGCAFVAYDMSEQVRHERRLAQAHAQSEARAEQLARSNRDLEAFASALSHDLREPLRTTAGFVRLITDRYGAELPAPARDLFGYVSSGTERMNERITAILSFARSGAAAAPAHPVDSAAAAAAAARDTQVLLTEANAELDLGPLPTVSADELQLQRVFQNLITNATKYTRHDTVPHITIRAERLDDHWHFTVADNGPGVPEAQRERIFAMFVRGNPDDTHEGHDGHGMGLALCRRIIESYQGHIWVEPNPDGGSLFRFTLPVADTAPEPTPSS